MVSENMKYGRLTTLYKNGHNKNRAIIWHCKCDCGNEIDVASVSLASGNTKSCGCLLKDSAKKRGKKSRRLNKYDLSNSYGIGYTSSNEKFYFDIEDYSKIKDYSWRLNQDGYVVSTPYGKLVRMHILIMNPPKGMDIDHKNHIVCDNRKENLRICEHYQNIISSKTYANNKSGRKGVFYDKVRNKWMSYITVNKKNMYLGRFDKFEDAIKARSEAEKIYHKEFAYK